MEDRKGIEALRVGQADAITRCDAEAYGRLCTDDIVLVFPERDVIEGRRAFIACEKELFQAPRLFNAVRKYPLRIERSADLVIEIGRHELCAAQTVSTDEHVLAKRKYLHVMRKTPPGWRFSVLTSNQTSNNTTASSRAVLKSVTTMTTTTSNQTEAPQWIGDFSPEDRAQIEALRLGQAAAIEEGDADAYARLCADDVHLMLPGRDIVAGREQLHQLEASLFREAKFEGMRKSPVRIERSGDLAIEVGRQEFATKAGAFATKQKYTHVMRKTSAGWRFAVLMSNNSVAL